MAARPGTFTRVFAEWRPELGDVCYNFRHHSGVVQLVAQRPLEPFILVRVQAPEPRLARESRGIQQPN